MTEELSADVIAQAVEDRLSGFNDEQMMFTYQIVDFSDIDRQVRGRVRPAVGERRTTNRRYRVSDAAVTMVDGGNEDSVCVGCVAAVEWALQTNQLTSDIDVLVVTRRGVSCARCDVVDCTREQNEKIVKRLGEANQSCLVVWDGTLSGLNMDNVFAAVPLGSAAGMAITSDDIAGIEYSKRQKRVPLRNILICTVEN
jgi:hypothetical protein